MCTYMKMCLYTHTQRLATSSVELLAGLGKRYAAGPAEHPPGPMLPGLSRVNSCPFPEPPGTICDALIRATAANASPFYVSIVTVMFFVSLSFLLPSFLGLFCSRAIQGKYKSAKIRAKCPETRGILK